MRKKSEVKCRRSIFSRGAIVSWLGENGKGGWLAKLSFLSKPIQSAQSLSHAHANPHTDAPDPPTHKHKHLQYIHRRSTGRVRVSSPLTILCPRKEKSCLMAGTHHIITIIIPELTLSVCDLLLTQSPVLLSSPPISQIWWPGTSVFFQPHLMRILRLHRNNVRGLQKVCVCL